MNSAVGSLGSRCCFPLSSPICPWSLLLHLFPSFSHIPWIWVLSTLQSAYRLRKFSQISLHFRISPCWESCSAGEWKLVPLGLLVGSLKQPATGTDGDWSFTWAPKSSRGIFFLLLNIFHVYLIRKIISPNFQGNLTSQGDICPQCVILWLFASRPWHNTYFYLQSTKDATPWTLTVTLGCVKTYPCWRGYQGSARLGSVPKVIKWRNAWIRPAWLKLCCFTGVYDCLTLWT